MKSLLFSLFPVENGRKQIIPDIHILSWPKLVVLNVQFFNCCCGLSSLSQNKLVYMCILSISQKPTASVLAKTYESLFFCLVKSLFKGFSQNISLQQNHWYYLIICSSTILCFADQILSTYVYLTRKYH